jgi:sugar phosphate isomerase/epimerase
MTIGLSTYSFFWRHSERVGSPLGLAQMIEETARLGVGLFQVCDYPQVERMSRGELVALRELAAGLGVTLELGTRGVRAAQLGSYLDLAGVLGASMLRTMLQAGDERDESATDELRGLLPRLDDHGITLALETYEQVATSALVDLVAELGSDRVGICLDVANVVARYESQRDVIDRVAGSVVNLHVKDFRFVRSEGLVGFALTGAQLGSGDLDVEYLFERVRPNERGISQIVEHWLPWQGDEQSTVRAEQAWTLSSVDYLCRQKEAYKSTG